MGLFDNDKFGVKRKSKDIFNAFQKGKNGEYLYKGKYINVRKKYLDQVKAFQNEKYSNLANFGKAIPVVEDDSLVDDAKDSNAISSNGLHQFATYNTIFTLSGITEEELTTHKFLNNPVHDIIAQSGGIGDPNISDGRYKSEQDELKAEIREKSRYLTEKYNENYSPEESVKVLSAGHDLFFENFNMLSTVGPNSDRGLANITKMNFELHEPFGVTFVEKVKAATFINGYRDFQDAPLLLTIEFKGQTHNDNFKRTLNVPKAFVRKIPILLVRVEFDVNEAGSTYQVVAVPHGDLAHDDRFKFPRTVLNISCRSLDDPDPKKGWIAGVTDQLKKQMEQEITEKKRKDPDEYEFIISSEVKKFAYYNKSYDVHLGESPWASWWRKLFGGDKNPLIELAGGVVDGQTSLVKFFEDAIRIGGGFSNIVDKFWIHWYLKMTKNDTALNKSGKFISDGGTYSQPEPTEGEMLDFFSGPDFVSSAKNNQWIDWFEIKVSVETINPEYIDPIRKVSPKRIIFKAIPKKIHVLKFFPPGVGLGFVDWSKWVRKKYNYIYTGENVDIQNLRINYKTAYYLRNIRPFDKDAKEDGKYRDFENNLIEAFGESAGEPVSPIRQEVSQQKGSNSMKGDADKTQQFYDYITNPEADMIRLEMDILGDPAFICQDQFIPIHKNRSVTKAEGIGNSPVSLTYRSFNSENFQPLIQLQFITPPEINDKTGSYNLKNVNADSRSHFFNGIYQVVKVDTKFNQGQFTQTLHCVRLNQQQGTKGEIRFSNVKTDAKKEDGKKHFTETKGWQQLYGITDEVTSGLTEEQDKKMDNIGKKEIITGKNPWDNWKDNFKID